MISLTPWLRRRYRTVLLILAVLQILFLALGTPLALRLYRMNRETGIRQTARQILLAPGKLSEDARKTLENHSGPLFVFSPDGRLLYSNRGQGRGIPQEEHRPVRRDAGREESPVIGYYYAGDLRFLADQGNQLFLGALGLLLVLSLAVSFLLGGTAAGHTAHRIARPIQILDRDIRRIRRLEPLEQHPFRIRELADISANLSAVSRLLADSEDYKRRWMQNLAHDLRTPAAALRSQLEGMRDGVLPPTQDRLNQNLEELTHLEEMAASLGLLAQVEQQPRLRREPVIPREFLQAMAAASAPRREKRGLRLSLQLPLPDRPFGADKTLLLRAGRNLMDNAARYAPEGELIEAGILFTEAPEVLIYVWNSGPPIPEEQARQIFQRFHRGDASRHTPGTGLGLTIAREISRLHGGDLSLSDRRPDNSSKDTPGICFRITLPLRKPEQSPGS